MHVDPRNPYDSPRVAKLLEELDALDPDELDAEDGIGPGAWQAGGAAELARQSRKRECARLSRARRRERSA